MLKIIKAKTCLGSSNPGTELAPDTLFKAGLDMALKQNGFSYEQITIPTINSKARHTSKDKTKHPSELKRLNEEIYKETLASLKQNHTTIILGGDHSVSIGSMLATKTFAENAMIIYIDAHPDSQSPETSISGNIHGMPLATVLGDSLYKDFKYEKAYKKQEVILLGVKDIDRAEWDYIKRNKIKFFAVEDIIKSGIGLIVSKVLRIVDKKPVHISIDIDSVDTEYAPGTGVINKGGLTYREIKYICKKLSILNVKTVDLVEINPKMDVENKTVNLGIEILLDLLGGDWSPYNQYLQGIRLKGKSEK